MAGQFQSTVWPSQNRPAAVDVAGVKSKLPEDKAFSETPFWTLDGGLSVQHPSQTDMFAGPRDAAERPRNQETA